jgi:hypothetical protein
MATDDVQRLVAGVAPTPAHFTVPGNGQIQPKAIFAHFNGTNAAATFQPAVKVFSDGGELVGIYPTQIPVAAGGSADVSWFPNVNGIVPSNPGTILQTYTGLSPAVDFSYSSNVYIPSNFPTNTTFNKLSDTSALLMLATADFTTGNSPDGIFLAIFVDGAMVEGNCYHCSLPNNFMTVNVVKIQGLAQNPLDAPFTAGPHTIQLRVANGNGSTVTCRTSTSVDLEMMEFEA